MARTPDREKLNLWRKVVARYEASELSLRHFCETEGIALSTLNYWRSRVGQGRAPGPGFIELTPVAERSARGSDGVNLVLELPGGIVLRLEGLPR